MKKAMLLLSAFLFAGSASAANLVLNGSFEDPTTTENSWKVYYDGEVSNWNVGEKGIEIRNDLVGEAFHGNNFAELDTDFASSTNSWISQDLTTEVGEKYYISFAYSGRINQEASTNTIDVFWNNSLVDSVTQIGGTTHDWTIYTYVVTGTGQDSIKFAASGNDDTLGGSLDAVSVSAVPVPAAAFLFAPALVGFMALRRKTSKAA
jgi:hypothetical protein